MVADSVRQVALRIPSTTARALTVDVERIVREHARFVFRVAFSVLRNVHDAEDAAQETFVRVLRQSDCLAAVEDPRAWIGTIAWRVAAGRRRARQEDVDLAAGDVERLRASGVPLDDVIERAELATLLWGTVATLPPELRDALTLSTVREMTSVQAAAVLGVPEGTVRNRVHRAKLLLRTKLTALLERRGRR